MVNKNRQNSGIKGLSIDKKIQILVNYGDISLIRKRKDCTEKEKLLVEIKNSLKRAYIEGKLTEEQIKLLEEHGMAWNKKIRGKKALEDLISSGVDIVSIKQKGKNLTEEERRLGEIKHYLKRLYREGELSEDIIRRAEEHGMVWDNSEIRGIKALNTLINSGLNIGRIKTKGKNLTEEERRLGEAKHYLKRLYKKGELSEDIIRKAEEHGMVWTERKTKRKTRLETLKREKEELDDKEAKAKALLEEVERQAEEIENQQSKSVLDGEER